MLYLRWSMASPLRQTWISPRRKYLNCSASKLNCHQHPSPSVSKRKSLVFPTVGLSVSLWLAYPTTPHVVILRSKFWSLPKISQYFVELPSFVLSPSFFLPIRPTSIRIAEDDGRSKGYCFVEFASKADLGSAMDKNSSFLLNRRVTMRLADQQVCIVFANVGTKKLSMTTWLVISLQSAHWKVLSDQTNHFVA